jgi:hypothetical protein
MSATTDFNFGTVTKKIQRWTKEQDRLLVAAVKEYGEQSWTLIAKRVPHRKESQCLHRWKKVLNPRLVRKCVLFILVILRLRPLFGFPAHPASPTAVPGGYVHVQHGFSPFNNRP